MTIDIAPITPEIIDHRRWVFEHLSDYVERQTFGAMRRGEKFCFLGMLCDAWHRITGQGEWVHHSPLLSSFFPFVTPLNGKVEGIAFGYDTAPPAWVLYFFGLTLAQVNEIQRANDQERRPLRAMAERFIPLPPIDTERTI